MKLQNLSIKRKLMLITMLASTLALLLFVASFFFYDLISFRHFLSQDLATQAEIIGYNSAAAMAFKDEAAATVTLTALKAKEDITAAILYTPDGKAFTRYVRANIADRPLVADNPQVEGIRFKNSYLEVVHVVSLNGEPVGTLFLQSDMSQWNARAKRYAIFLLVFMLASDLLALLIASKLQTLISGPILRLEDTMHMVSVQKNYEVRALKFYDDEIGRLIDGFNTMLSEIQQGDSALQSANDALKAQTLKLESEIIQRKQAQDELLSAKRTAEDASRAKSSFLANMSHELRTPLNAIIGYSEMIEEEIQDTGQFQNVQDVKKIQSAGKHLLSLINDVLDLSKIEAGKMGLHLENFDVAQIIQEMVSTFQPTISKNSNTLEVSLAEDLGLMRADVTKVRQILFNLMSNACKFTSQGTISLDVQRTTATNQEWLRFRVSDTGIGISTEQQKNLFKEFAQADVSISRKYGGTGLGLAISHRFAQLMGGYFTAESEPGKGSVFTVYLPARVTSEAAEAANSKESSEAKPEASQPVSQTDTILVIDDDPAVRDLMFRFLVKSGFHVVVAADGEEGLKLAKRIQPRIITLDVLMPGINGWEVLRRMKADPDLAGIPVIMVTIVDNEIMGLNLGSSSYLMKPVDRALLADVIEKHRRTRAPSSEDISVGV